MSKAIIQTSSRQKTGRNHGIRKNTGAKKRLGAMIKKLEKNFELQIEESGAKIFAK